MDERKDGLPPKPSTTGARRYVHACIVCRSTDRLKTVKVPGTSGYDLCRECRIRKSKESRPVVSGKSVHAAPTAIESNRRRH